MLITPELFLDCIILLIHDNGSKNQAIVAELLNLYDEESKGKSASVERDSLTLFYIRVIKGLLSNKFDPSNPDECRHYLLKLRSDVALEKRRDLYDLLSDAFLNRDKMKPEKLEEIARSIQNQLIWNRMNKAARRLFGRLGNAQDTISADDQGKELRAILDEMEEVVTSCSKSVETDHAAGMVDRVSFGDRDTMKAALTKHKDRTVTGGIRTGLQGLNRMFGKLGHIPQGSSVVFNALSHHYKSGMLQSMAMWAPLYNKPPAVEGKKPMILMVTIENEAFQNFIWISRKVYFQETGNDANDLSQDDLIDWVHKRFSQSGFELEILRYLPEQFGYDELVALLAHYEQIGYIVYMVIIDYMNNMKKGSGKGASDAANHLAVKELYNRVCNYTKTKGATLITAHQLNRKAQELANTGRTNVVKAFNSEHLADSMDVQREVDASIFMHIEKNHEGFPFLTLALSKLRYSDGEVPEAHKFCAYPFVTGGILDDITGSPGFVKDIYAWSIDKLAGTGNDALIASYKELQAGGSDISAAVDIF